MAKGDDAIARKRNKSRRKKDTKKVSNHIKAIIAAKQRRKSGKRRICEGMCFSLPTPDNPFNDPVTPKEKQKKTQNSERVIRKSGANSESDHLRGKKRKTGDPSAAEIGASSTPSQRLVCTAENGHSSTNFFTQEEAIKLSRHLLKELRLEEAELQENMSMLSLDNKWTKLFLEAIFEEKNILASSQTPFDVQWATLIASAAAAHITARRIRCTSNHGVEVLILVASQQQALKVRNVCKPLKMLFGIRSVSLHPGASMDHQIEGLRSCIPNILVSDPVRLLELVELKAVDISHISFMIVDGLRTVLDVSSIDIMEKLRDLIFETPQTVILSDCYAASHVPVVQRLLHEPIQKLLKDSLVAIQSACIVQSVFVLLSEENKTHKLIKVLGELNDAQQYHLLGKITILVDSAQIVEELTANLQSKGYFEITTGNSLQSHESIGAADTCKKRLHITISRENLLDQNALAETRIMILYSFPSSIATYTKLLTGMAKHSASGMLYSFLCGRDALRSAPLINVLQQCSQPVPKALQMMSDAASLVQK